MTLFENNIKRDLSETAPTPCTLNVLNALAGNSCAVEQPELLKLGCTSETCFHFTQETVFFLNGKIVTALIQNYSMSTGANVASQEEYNVQGRTKEQRK